MKNHFQYSHLDPETIETIEACPYCKSERAAFVAEEAGFFYVQCQECNLIRLKNRMREEFVGLIYDDDYRPNVNPDYELNMARKRLKLFGFPKSGKTLHEDGAGIGSFAFVAGQAGHTVTASDPGSNAVRLARELFGVELLHESLEGLRIESGSLDGFACFNLLSHLYRPWGYIGEVARILRPGGKFLFRTGDRRGYFKTCGLLGAPEHVFHYDRAFLKKMLETHGLVIQRIVPAFDSDFPLTVIMPENEFANLKGARQFLLRNLSRMWNVLKLPKEDIFVVATKR